MVVRRGYRPLGVKANSEQEALGDSIQAFVEANIRRWQIYYIIYWNWMRYSTG